MTLTVHPEMEQRSDEWYDLRRGIVTASAIGQLITRKALTAFDFDCPDCGANALGPCFSKAKGKEGPIKTFHQARIEVARESDALGPLVVADGDVARGLTATLAAERISGNTDVTWQNNDMLRGQEDEPRAVAIYSEKYAPVERVGFMVRDDWGFSIGYSPDGLVGDDGLIEVKSRRQKTHLLSVVAGEVPAANMAQIQCGLLVSGRKWCDYLSYCGGMHLWPKRVYPDPEWFEVIIAAVRHFESEAVEMVANYEHATQGLALTERVNPFEVELIL